MHPGFFKGGVVAVAVILAGSAFAQTVHAPAEVRSDVRHDVSPPLRDLEHKAPAAGPPHEHLKIRATPHASVTGPYRDTAVQAAVGTQAATISGLNFAGVGVGFSGPQGVFAVATAPPDTNGAAGVTQYVQWVNTSFAIFDKATGSPLYGPAPGNTLWTGFGGACETNNDGDILVKYDRAAGRWVFSQLAIVNGPPFYQCVAVSTGIDATGAYNRYAFSFPNLNDYPKMGIWPDGYYFSFNMFQGQTTFLGASACAADRNQMVAGGPATMQCFPLSPGFGAILPSDLDGITPPPAGTPNFLVGLGAASLNLWKLHVDFANPANSALTGPNSTAVAAYSDACNGGGTCIPQSGTKQKLDSVGDRPMYRMAYRNFGDHEALVLNHSIASGSSVAVRWYELRNPNGGGTLYQQGTFAPDSKYRWMGSIAMDKVGDIALGYSASSGNMHPAIRYTGRGPSDPLGAMQAETSIIEGGGSQLPYLGALALSRWGDYSSMAIDPGDDCTFWYTNEYLIANGSFNWSTRIASFSFPACTAAPPAADYYISASPSSRLTGVGTSAAYTVNLSALGGFSSAVNFSAGGLPAGVTAGFSPASLTGSGSTTLTLTVAPGTPPGTYTATITAASGGLSHTALVTLQVYVPATALLVKTDTATQGTWKGTYGSDGEAIPNDSANYPAYAQVSLNGTGSYTWAGSTADTRAPQKAAASDRIASTWYSGTSFTIDVNLTDGNPHLVGLYSLDWDNQGRAQTFEVMDAVSGSVLDSRSVAGFGNGVWLLWNLSGHVTLRVTRTAGVNAAVSGIFFSPPAPPDFSISAAPTKQVVTQGGSTTYTVTVASSAGFAGTVNLSASGLPAGASASFNPASVAGGGTSTMTVTTIVPTAGGAFTLNVTGTSGSLSHSAPVSLVVNVPVPAAAVFVKTDTATQGTWKGVYGADGEAIPSDSANYPAYAQVTFTGSGSYTWAASTTDVRAPQKAAAADRIASTWYTGTSFSIDVNLMDGNPHEVGVYCLDWDNQGRVQTIDILDAASGTVLDTRSVSGFLNGVWALWNLSGHVTLRITRTGGTNAGVSGVFFNAPAPADFALSITPGKQVVGQGGSAPYTVSLVPLAGFAGTVSLSATGLPAGISASFSPASIGGNTSSTMTVTAGATTPGGVYPVTVNGTAGSLSHTAGATLVVSVPAVASAVFVKTDAATEGSWKGVYGSDGEAIPADSANYPAYAQVSLTGTTPFTWAASTADVRAVQKAAASDRIASTWYGSSSFTMDVNLMDGNPHQVGLYCLDWDNAGRAQRIDVLDAGSGQVLDSRNLSGFSNGTWLVWNLGGHVALRVTLTGGISGTTPVVSGVFFDVAPPDFAISASPASRSAGQGGTAAYTVTVSSSAGFSGTVNLSASGLPAGATASFNPPSVNNSGSSTMTVTVGASTPGGVSNITVTGTRGTVSHSAQVTLVVTVPVAAAAAFVKTDSTTQGTWKSVYGAAGETIANDSANYPLYVQVSFSGANAFTWAPSTSDVRALQTASGTGRIASTWYSSASFTIDLNLADGNPHQVGVYCLDWDSNTRAQTIDVLDAVNGNVLDSRSVSGFNGGVWVLWNLSGHVTLRVTRTGGANAVLSGVFWNN